MSIDTDVAPGPAPSPLSTYGPGIANFAATCILAYSAGGLEWAGIAVFVAGLVFLLPLALRHAERVPVAPAPARPERRAKVPGRDGPNAHLFFLVNLVMLVLIGVLAFGAEALLVFALIAAPIWLAGIAVLVVRSAYPKDDD